MRVFLKRNLEDGSIVEEVIELVSESDCLFTTEGDQTGLKVSDLVIDDLVLFEDEYGLCGIKASQIISMTPIEESQL